jgi:hemin uptake protein HemP
VWDEHHSRAMPDKPNQNDQTTVPPTVKRTPRMILSRELLGSDKLVIIRHEQEDYRLQITATGKLILTK